MIAHFSRRVSFDGIHEADSALHGMQQSIEVCILRLAASTRTRYSVSLKRKCQKGTGPWSGSRETGHFEGAFFLVLSLK
jgi:hypothetical protein